MLSRVPKDNSISASVALPRAEKCGGFFEAGLSLIARNSAAMFEFVNKWQIDDCTNPAERPA